MLAFFNCLTPLLSIGFFFLPLSLSPKLDPLPFLLMPNVELRSEGRDDSEVEEDPALSVGVDRPGM